MRALLIKKWGEHYAGQVMTAYAPGSIPEDVAVWYGDDEIIPVLPVANDVIDPDHPALAVKRRPLIVEPSKKGA